MDGVAREIQLARPRVYAAYPTRDDLLAALREREQTTVIADLAQAMPEFEPDRTFANILTEAATNLLTAASQRPESWLLLLAPADGGGDELRALVDQSRDFALGRLRDLVRWGIANKSLPDTDVELLAESLLAIGEQATRRVVTDPEQYTPERYAAFIAQALSVIAPK